jgi:hypothetical protein
LKFKIYLININILKERAGSRRNTKIEEICSNLDERGSKRQHQIEEEGEIELEEASQRRRG